MSPLKRRATVKPEQSDQKENKNTIQVLDGVRAIATLMVMSFHIQQKSFIWDESHQEWISAIWTFGGSGVTLFFVLSGFLLFLPYAKALLFQAPWPSLKQFYLRRALRILPAYYVALFGMILIFQQQYLNPHRWGQLLLFLTLFMDSTHETFRALNAPFWTLAIEWQFYLLLPLIALGFLFCVNRLAGSPRRRLIAIMACCLLLITWGLFMRWIGLNDQSHPTSSPIFRVILFFLYGMSGKYLENFAVGMALSACYVYSKNSERTTAWLRRISIPVGIFGLLLFLFTAAWHFYMLEMKTPLFAQFASLAPYFFWLYEAFIALAYASMIFALLFGHRIIRRPLEWKLLGQIGLLSFGLYMWHMPWLRFFETNILPILPGLDKYGAYVAYWVWIALIVLPIAILSYRYVERPAMQRAHRKPVDVKVEVESEPQTVGVGQVDSRQPHF